MDSVNINELLSVSGRIFERLPSPGVLLAAGTKDSKENLITIGWLQTGFLWGKPVIDVYIRESRYSYNLLQEDDEFTVNVMDQKFNEALKICATTSGSYCDKYKEANLTKVKSKVVDVVSVKEASLVLECKILYRSNLDKDNLSDIVINKFYSNGDFHQVITAEVLNIKDMNKNMRDSPDWANM